MRKKLIVFGRMVSFGWLHKTIFGGGFSDDWTVQWSYLLMGWFTFLINICPFHTTEPTKSNKILQNVINFLNCSLESKILKVSHFVEEHLKFLLHSHSVQFSFIIVHIKPTPFHSKLNLFEGKWGKKFFVGFMVKGVLRSFLLA